MLSPSSLRTIAKEYGDAESPGCWINAAADEITTLTEQVEVLKEENERLRLQLAGCGVVAMANTRDAAAKARDMHPDYKCASIDDVATAVDREMDERKRAAILQSELDDTNAKLRHARGKANMLRARIKRVEGLPLEWRKGVTDVFGASRNSVIATVTEHFASDLQQALKGG